MNYHFFIFLLLSFNIFACQSSHPVETSTVSMEKTAKIYPGSYQLDAYLNKLKDKSIGIVVNQTSMVENVHLVDTLLALDVSIKAIFSPEHGFKGEADAGEKIADDLYLNSIPIVSLYGSKRKPAAEDLKDIDLLVFDIQDVGVRFYTYISTLHYVMEAASEAKIPVLLLDRPNPNGYFVDGPVREEEFKSFVGMHPVPVVYGMTIGEYATMINGEGWLPATVKVDLEVVPCQNYDHDSRYVLPIAPSPNLPNERAILLYPSLCLFEGTTFSIGRGTSMQFQIYGHPDYSTEDFTFVPISNFGARSPKHKDVTCKGVDLRLLSIDEIRSWRKVNFSYFYDAHADAQSLGISFFNDNNFFEKLAGVATLRHQIMNGESLKEIRATWQPDLDAFMKVRAKYLLYPDFKS